MGSSIGTSRVGEGDDLAAAVEEALRHDNLVIVEQGVYARLRKGVAERLLAAQDALPDGLRLLVIEGYRPYRAQLEIFSGYHDELRRAHPDWSPERVYEETTKFVPPVEVAPHSTGGAVDLTLCTADGVVALVVRGSVLGAAEM
ncbi:M15 family metallopeptidase domain-containing protein [Micromonospora craniellae]|uniref:D-alanyl-D-alanine carboxypeptidase family protein n=1 Tax=Micromonospora craniellae TaxID=2294034 RepID=UPI00168B825A|nr:D-alanyl-D-alanine carboxypeptidase family protein [Micromonospora craniellae]QOC93564.1 D-alanyl-D-alanine carboxypeptidase family protein [Micromonospora craniellae]